MMAGPAYNLPQSIKNIRPEQLDIKKGELSGDLISGGLISNFASTGISDKSTVTSLIVKDGIIEVDKVQTKEIPNDLLVSGNLEVAGELKVKKLVADEIFSEQKYDKQYIEFYPTEQTNTTIGSGFIWKEETGTKMFVLRANPTRFFSSEGIDLHSTKSYHIDGIEVLNRTTLGRSIKKSSLREVGTLETLTVTGDTTLGDFLHIKTDLLRIGINTDQPAGILTLTDFEGDVLLNLEVENGRGKIGTYNNRPLDLTAGDQALLTLEPKGVISIGHEYRSDIQTRAWGKVGINVKHPEEDLEVRGNIRFRDKLFMVDNSSPTKGNYKRGDIVWNENPTAGSSIGWVCTVAGSPGTWKPFGAISE